MEKNSGTVLITKYFLYTPQTGLSSEDVSTKQMSEENVRSIVADYYC